MLPTITMFCKDCGKPITGQFAATCIKCVSNSGAQAPQADNKQSTKCTCWRCQGFEKDPYGEEMDDAPQEKVEAGRTVRAKRPVQPKCQLCGKPMVYECHDLECLIARIGFAPKGAGTSGE